MNFMVEDNTKAQANRMMVATGIKAKGYTSAGKANDIFYQQSYLRLGSTVRKINIKEIEYEEPRLQ